MASTDLEARCRELRHSLEALPEVVEPPKSMLRILGAPRSERRWTTVLAYFLDPQQPHGFGADLLKQFLDTATQQTDAEIEYYHRDIEDVSVDTEVTSPEDNRLDILIRAPESWFVCIEAKVDAPEGSQQTHRYLCDPHIGREAKSDYPEGGQHYIFLSKRHAADARADGFANLAWEDVVATFHDHLNFSQGQYPDRSVAQLQDFLSTVITVTNMGEDEYTQTLKERIRLLAEYREDIDKLEDAAEKLRQRAIEEWPELFRQHVDAELWGDDWMLRAEPENYGCIFKKGWYLDNDTLAPTNVPEETWGDTGFRLHFNHMIRRKESFNQGELTYRLGCATSVPLHDEFHQRYNSDEWHPTVASLLDERDITDKGNKSTYMIKTYDVDQSRLPESYFETLAVAFEEHLPIANVIDDILAEALENVQRP